MSIFLFPFTLFSKMSFVFCRLHIVCWALSFIIQDFLRKNGQSAHDSVCLRHISGSGFRVGWEEVTSHQTFYGTLADHIRNASPDISRLAERWLPRPDRIISEVVECVSCAGEDIVYGRFRTFHNLHLGQSLQCAPETVGVDMTFSALSRVEVDKVFGHPLPCK